MPKVKVKNLSSEAVFDMEKEDFEKLQKKEAGKNIALVGDEKAEGKEAPAVTSVPK